MVKNNADVELVTHVKRSLAALDEYERSFKAMFDKMDRTMKRTEKTVKTTGQKFAGWGKSLGKSIMGMAGFLTIMQTVRTVAQLITKELEAQAELNRKARERTIGFVPAMEKVRMQLPASSNISFQEIKKQIISSDVPDKPGLAGVVLGAISSSGSDDQRSVVKTAIRTAEARPALMANDPEAVSEIAEAIVVNQRVWGGSFEEQFGFLHRAASAARTKDMSKFGKYISGGAALMKPRGYTQKEAFQLMAAFGTAVNDSDGTVTATNVLSMVLQMEEEAVKGGIKDRGMSLLKRLQDPNDAKAVPIAKKLQGAFYESASADEKAAAKEMMSGDPAKWRGRQKAKPVFIALLQPGDVGAGEGGVKDLLKATEKLIPTRQEAAAAFRQDMAERAKDPYWQAFKIDNAIKNEESQNELNPTRSVRATYLDSIQGLHERAGGWSTVGTAKTWLAKLSAGSITPEGAQEKLQQEVDSAQANVIISNANSKFKSQRFLGYDEMFGGESYTQYARDQAKRHRFDETTAGNIYTLQNIPSLAHSFAARKLAGEPQAGVSYLQRRRIDDAKETALECPRKLPNP